MEVGRQDYSQVQQTEWQNLSFLMLVLLAWIPILVTSVLLIGFAWWESGGQNLEQSYYAMIVFIVYVLVFGGYSASLLSRGHFTRSHVVVIMGFTGFMAGLLIAIGKLMILYRGWALLRLVSEPILTALFAAIIGALVFWRRTQLKS